MRREERSATSISSSVARVFWAGQPSRLAASVRRIQLRAMLGSRSSVSKEARILPGSSPAPVQGYKTGQLVCYLTRTTRVLTTLSTMLTWTRLQKLVQIAQLGLSATRRRIDIAYKQRVHWTLGTLETSLLA
jgi:hypothetical protein